ncbi:MAG TPA: flagellar hook-basal body complex protein FliE [Clostridia bacterium]
MPIPAISSLSMQKIQSVSELKSASGSSAAASEPFADMLGRALDQVGAAESEAQAKSASLLTGETESIHSVVLASEKAEVALQLTLQIRNKVLDAYNEVMRMQI